MCGDMDRGGRRAKGIAAPLKTRYYKNHTLYKKRERALMQVSDRERELEFRQKCRFDIKAFFDHEA